jgi:hypothetical protein
VLDLVSGDAMLDSRNLKVVCFAQRWQRYNIVVHPSVKLKMWSNHLRAY